MIALAVVGPICSGKSLVLDRLGTLGAVTLSADVVAREVTRPGSRALGEIAAAFGDAYLRGDGSLDRARLAELVFRDTAAREVLEGLLHPLILTGVREWLDEQRRRPDAPGVAAVEVLRLPPQLGVRGLFDVVWLCRAPREVRRCRLMARDGLPEEEAERRLAVQETQPGMEDSRPDLVLDTGGPRTEVDALVCTAWEGLSARS